MTHQKSHSPLPHADQSTTVYNPSFRSENSSDLISPAAGFSFVSGNQSIMEEFLDNIPPMDLMRSEKMTFVQLIIPVESAHRAISYLGELGILQFRDVCFQFFVLY